MKMRNLIIRQERRADCSAVYALIEEAFRTAEHADGNEQDLVEALRKSEAFLPELSLVAEIDGELAGHILFTKVKIGRTEAVALAPLSVRPKYQRQGVGTALIREGHRIAAGMGYPVSLVLGSREYYPKMGYVPAQTFGIEIPQGFPAENYMACRLRKTIPLLEGPVVYAREFGL